MAIVTPSPLRACGRNLGRPSSCQQGAIALRFARCHRRRTFPPAQPPCGPNPSSCRRAYATTAAMTSSNSSCSGGGGSIFGGKGRGMKALGAVASLAAVGALAREAHLPESFSEWDDQLQWEEVHELAQLSNMTHKDPRLVARWFDCHQYNGALIARDLPQVSNHYFLHVGHLPRERHRRVHHLAIRGTVSLADLSIDLKTRHVFDEECGCVFHAGFKEVADAVVQDLEKFLEPGVPIKITGHSLGGAVAVIVAAKLKLRGHNVGKVMTFGAPMVTDAAGAATVGNLLPVLRVTHERDPIPLTPLASESIAAAAAVKLLSKSGRGRQSQSESQSQNQSQSQGQGQGQSQSQSQSRTQAPLTGERRERQEEEEEEEVKQEEVVEQLDRVNTSNGGAFAAEVESEGARGGTSVDGERSEPRVWRSAVKSSPAYAHFGSQAVLLRRKGCIECYREKAAATTGPSSILKKWLMMASSYVPRGGDNGSGVGAGVASSDGGSGEGRRWTCDHCPSRGRTYYHPKGEDDCLFDSPWLRLSHPNYIHRMNHYEKEIYDRLEHHRMRAGNVNLDVGALSSPSSSSNSSSSSSAAAAPMVGGASIVGGSRSPTEEGAESTEAAAAAAAAAAGTVQKSSL